MRAADVHRLPVTNPASPALRTLLEREGERISAALGEPGAGAMFVRLMLNTWQTTMTRRPDGLTFVITGDIPAMWLRDSAAQVRPFLWLAPESGEVAACLAGLVAQQWECIERAPYANAFNPAPNGASWHAADLCDDPWVWEEKYEIDSLAFPVQLAHQLWQATGDDTVLGPVRARAGIVLDLWRREQHHDARSAYRFVRPGTGDTLGPDGRGTPVGVTGMTWSGFRPSDDPCTHGYNIPAQLFAAHALDLLADMARRAWDEPGLAAQCAELAAEIRAGVERWGRGADGSEHAGVLAYEVDGLGAQLFMDDANMPSLLSLPLCSALGADDPTYLATRRFVLSDANPQFWRGRHAEGVGSPHTDAGRVWPIALAVQGLTSTDADERRRLARVLMDTTGGTGMMHEGFDPDDPTRYTRPWFSWANAMFCELLLTLAQDARATARR